MLAPDQVLSAGLIDGRNIWRSDLDAASARVEALARQRGDKLWLAPSCSLLHVPVDLDAEQELDTELKGWHYFTTQQPDQLRLFAVVLDTPAYPGTRPPLPRPTDPPHPPE